MAVCPGCGAQIDDTETVCPKCGHDRSSAVGGGTAMATALAKSSGSPTVPSLVRVAGIVWIVFGSLGLLNGALVLLQTLAGAEPGDAACALPFIALISGGFIYVGRQSVQGTARDMLGNGIGSILFSLFNLGYGIVLMIAAERTGWEASGTIVPALIGNLLSGVGLLVAGVLALVGRQDYKAWRRAHKVHTPAAPELPRE